MMFLGGYAPLSKLLRLVVIVHQAIILIVKSVLFLVQMPTLCRTECKYRHWTSHITLVY